MRETIQPGSFLPRRRFRHLPSLLPAVLIGVFLAGCDTASDNPGSRQVAASAVPGFVLRDFRLVLPGAGPGDCPDGFNLSARAALAKSLSGSERVLYEADPHGYLDRAAPVHFEDEREDPCANPAGFEDPGMHVVEQPLAIRRLEPDGSLSQELLPASRCPATTDAATSPGERRIDNQYWRVMGCVGGYQPGALAEAMSNSQISEGNLTVLVTLESAPDDGADRVRIGVFSSVEPVATGVNGAILDNDSFALAADARYHNSASGWKRDNVVVSDPFDLRLIYRYQRLDSVLYLRDARLRLEIQPDGSATGFLGGYWDIESLAHAAIRIEDSTGLRSGSQAADAHGYSCPGKYHAVRRLADGHPDASTGQCTSISTLFSVEALPAFVLPPRQGSGHE